MGLEIAGIDLSSVDLSKLDWSTFDLDSLNLANIDLSTLDLSSFGLDLTKIPLVAPPKGVQPNFDNPSSTLAPAIIAVSAVMVILTFSLVVMRLYSNHHSARTFGYDDWTCIVATILLMAVVAMDVDLRSYARHDYDIPISWLTPAYIKKLFVIDILAGPSIFFAKTSLFLLYYRVFEVKKTMRFMIVMGIAFAFVVYILVMMPMMTYYCSPRIGKGWNFAVLESCRHSLVFGVCQGATNLFLDLFILALPIPVVLRLNLPLDKKIGVLTIFMTGTLAIIASIIGLFYRIKLLGTDDVEWGVFSVQICVLVETGATIMCSSMPALASLSRTLAAHSSYYASIRSKISRRYGQPASPSKVSLSNISSTSNNYTSTESSSKPYHQGGGAYIELSGRHTNSHYVGTTVYGGGAPAQGTHDVEKGAITKSVCIDQSSDRNSFT